MFANYAFVCRIVYKQFPMSLIVGHVWETAHDRIKMIYLGNRKRNQPDKWHIEPRGNLALNDTFRWDINSDPQAMDHETVLLKSSLVENWHREMKYGPRYFATIMISGSQSETTSSDEWKIRLHNHGIISVSLSGESSGSSQDCLVVFSLKSSPNDHFHSNSSVGWSLCFQVSWVTTWTATLVVGLLESDRKGKWNSGFMA